MCTEIGLFWASHLGLIISRLVWRCFRSQQNSFFKRILINSSPDGVGSLFQKFQIVGFCGGWSATDKFNFKDINFGVGYSCYLYSVSSPCIRTEQTDFGDAKTGFELFLFLGEELEDGGFGWFVIILCDQ